VVFFVFLFSNVNAQSKVYAMTLVSSDHVTAAGLGHDGLLATKADLVAKSNTLVFAGHDASIELEFATQLAANTPTYVKITAEDNLLGSLLGGSLGTLLSNVLGAVLTGNQEFVVEARLNSGTPMLSGSSTTASQFGTDKLRIVQNSAGEYFIRIMPDQAYNRIKITNKVGNALLGLGATRTLSVYDAYYVTGTTHCGEPAYTSFSAAGIISLASTGVTNAQNVLTTSTTDFSVLSMGLLALGSSIEQTVYYEGLSDAEDRFAIKIKTTHALLTAGIASNVSVIASNGGTAVQTKTLSELIALNLLTITGGQITTLYMTPGLPVDRITLRLNTAVSILQSLDFYGATKTPGLPLVNAAAPVCSGSAASLTATSVTSGAQFKWYDSPAATNLLATTISGQAFATPALNASATYYVQKIAGGCASLLESATAMVVGKPSSGTIEGMQTVCLTRLPTLLTSSSVESGVDISYRWESSTDQANWIQVASSNTVSYQPPMLTQATFFRRITIRTANGIACESVPTCAVKVSTRNCVVMSNPMVRQRIKNGA